MTLLTVGNSVRARLGRWPHDPDVVQVVLLDHHMVPTVADVEQWVAEASRSNPRCIRTGVMFPDASETFREVGFHPIDELALLEARLDRSNSTVDRHRARRSTRRMRASRFTAVAALDREAFGDPWGNDERSLRDVLRATPHHRARILGAGEQITGFAISGQSGAVGYLQRLAIHPEARREGNAGILVVDAMRWMRRRGARTAMVNTAIDNHPALGLYERHGFSRRPETLSIFELPLR